MKLFEVELFIKSLLKCCPYWISRSNWLSIKMTCIKHASLFFFIFTVSTTALASKSIQMEKMGSSVAAPASLFRIGKIQMERVLFADEGSNLLLTEACEHNRDTISQAFNDTCSSTNDEGVFYLFSPVAIGMISNLHILFSWGAPPGLGLSTCLIAEICQGSVKGRASKLCGACYCLDIYYKSVMPSGSLYSRRVHSQCGITLEEVAVLVPLEENALSCGYLEAVIFGATYNGNGTTSSVFINLRHLAINHVTAINQMQNEASFLTFNLPIAANKKINTQTGLFDCQKGRVVFFPISSTELATNGTLKVENTINLNSSSTYQFNVFAIDSNDNLPSETAINAICSELPLFKQLIEDCANQTITLLPPETTATPLNIPIIAGASVAAATVIIGGVIATLVTALICVKKSSIETE